MSERSSAYQSYLLRVLAVAGADNVVWRASLESAHTGERYNFATLQELFDFLRQQTGEAPAKPEK